MVRHSRKLERDSGIGYLITVLQELRIPTSLSKEPVWIKAFLSGDDVHKATAIQIWGEENYNKDLRK
ncbi:hypothetical protein, partial [Listeria monocytogenes]|uniref:hypothetical protein n=1 Tax=Listeria monocytogenes TaxID=1639 RepID=UPI002FDC79CB